MGNDNEEKNNVNNTNPYYSKLWITIYSVVLSLCNLNYGYAISYTSAAKVALVDSEILSPNYSNYYTSIMIIGCLLGSILGGFITMNKYGRKFTLASAAICYCVGYILSTIICIPQLLHQKITVFIILVIGRVLIGTGVGFNAVCVNAYQKELSIPSIKSYVTPLPPLSTNMGICFTYFIAYGVFSPDLIQLEKYIKSNRNNQKFIFKTVILWLPLIGIILSFYQLIIAYIMPESPIWKQLKGGNKDQMNIKMEKFARRVYRNSNLGKQFECETIENTTIKNSLKLLRKPENIKRIITSIIIMTFSNLVGIYPFLFNLNDIFQSSTSAPTKPVTTCALCDEYRQSNLNAVIVGVTSIISGGVSIIISRYMGRKLVGIFGSILLAIPLIALGLYYYFQKIINWLPVLCVVAYFVVYGLTWSYLPWVISTEIADDTTADMILGTASITNWITSFIVAFTFNPMADKIGISGAFTFYGVCCLISAIYIAIFVPETLNKSTYFIGDQYKSKKIMFLSLF